MPAAIPIAIAGAGALGFMGAKSQAGAAKDAAAAQERSSREALALQREQWVQQQQNQAPWLSAGQGAVSTLARLMGTPQPNISMPSPVPQPQGGLAQLAGQQNLAARGAGALLGQRGMVVLRAPDGSTQAVPEDAAQHYISKGAVRVN